MRESSHDWVVLFGEENTKYNREHKAFQLENQAIQFAETESSQCPSKVFFAGYLDKSTTPGTINVLAKYQAGENLTLKPIIEQCKIIFEDEKQEQISRTILLFVMGGIGLFGFVGIMMFCFSNFDPASGTILMVVLWIALGWIVNLPFRENENELRIKKLKRNEEIRELYSIVRKVTKL